MRCASWSCSTRQEGIVARRGEIRRIRQARLFWQGLQYAWWNPQDMTWHLPYESKIYDDSAMAEMPRYQFVTNIYQAFGLSFVSVIRQDAPATRFYPQSAQSNRRHHHGESGVAGVEPDSSKTIACSICSPALRSIFGPTGKSAGLRCAT